VEQKGVGMFNTIERDIAYLELLFNKYFTDEYIKTRKYQSPNLSGSSGITFAGYEEGAFSLTPPLSFNITSSAPEPTIEIPANQKGQILIRAALSYALVSDLNRGEIAAEIGFIKIVEHVLDTASKYVKLPECKTATFKRAGNTPILMHMSNSAGYEFRLYVEI